MEKYKRVKIVGKGTFGQAVLVESVENPSKQFVMKIIDASRLSQKQKEEALNEIHVLKAMRHPYVITYRESFVEKRCLCIVMDYADGGDLNEKIQMQKQKGQYFKEDQILDWFVQIALALKHIHDRKILHRDLKSQNIFLTMKGEIKLGDFGIARVLQGTDDCANTVIGTPYYLSPEICQEKPYNQRSDIWSLGCILYEMTMLRRAFEGSSLRELVHNILYEVHSSVSPHFSDNLRQLISELLHKDPIQRPSIKKILQKEFLAERVSRLLKNTLINYKSHSEVIFSNHSNRDSFNFKSEVTESVMRMKTPLSARAAPVELAEKSSKSFDTIKSHIDFEQIQETEHPINCPNPTKEKPVVMTGPKSKLLCYPVVKKIKPEAHKNEQKENISPNLVNNTSIQENKNKTSTNFIQSKIDYIVQQNLNLIKKDDTNKELVSSRTKQINCLPSPAIKNQYHSIYSQFQLARSSKKTVEDTTSALSSARRDETQPETQCSTRKSKDSLNKESPRISLDDTCLAEGQRLNFSQSNEDRALQAMNIKLSLQKLLGNEKFQRIYCYLKANRGRAIEVKVLIKIVGELNNNCLINFQKLMDLEDFKAY